MILWAVNFLARVWILLAAKMVRSKKAIVGVYDFVSPAVFPAVVLVQGRGEEGSRRPVRDLLSQ